MPYICCTQKLTKELSPKPLPLSPEVHGFLGWHGNLIHLFRRKCVLLVNDETRFTLFIPGLVKKDFADFANVFRHHFEKALGYMEANPAQIAQAKLLLGGFSYHKTHSRSVLGTMNDMKSQVEFMLKARLGHLPGTAEEHRWLASYLNETPCSGKDLDGFIIPAREMSKLINRVG